jgi:hypothetical protein
MPQMHFKVFTNLYLRFRRRKLIYLKSQILSNINWKIYFWKINCKLVLNKRVYYKNCNNSHIFYLITLLLKVEFSFWHFISPHELWKVLQNCHKSNLECHFMNMTYKEIDKWRKKLYRKIVGMDIGCIMNILTNRWEGP